MLKLNDGDLARLRLQAFAMAAEQGRWLSDERDIHFSPADVERYADAAVKYALNPPDGPETETS